MRVPIDNLHDVEMSYDEITTMAFDANTSEEYAIYLQIILLKAKNILDKSGDGWHRILFLKNPETGKIRLWFD